MSTVKCKTTALRAKVVCVVVVRRLCVVVFFVFYKVNFWIKFEQILFRKNYYIF